PPRRAVHRCHSGPRVRRRDHGRIPVRHHASQSRTSERDRGCARTGMEARRGCGRRRAARRDLRADEGANARYPDAPAGLHRRAGGRARDHHRALPAPADRESAEHQPAEGLVLLAQVASAGVHPLSGSVAEWLWLVPILPLLGFVINGLLAIVAVYHAGPADPAADGHGTHPTATAAPTPEAQTSVADDTRAVPRHRVSGV